LNSALAELLRSTSIPLLPALATGCTAWLYLRGFRVLHARAPARFPAWRRGAFLVGLALFLAAIASPLDALSGLFLEAHMLQHLLLGVCVPPLLWLGAPLAPLLRGLPADFRKHGLGPFLAWPALQRGLRWLVHPAVAWFAYFLITWLWHLPVLYDLALRSQGWHDVEHFSFLAAGLLFWFPVVQPWPSRPRWPRAALLPYLVLAGIFQSAFAALFAFSSTVFYDHYLEAPRLWGMGALVDQNAAGALLWVGTTLVLLVAVSALVVDLLDSPHLRRTAPLGPRSPRPADQAMGAFLLRGFASRRLRRSFRIVVAGLAGLVVVDGIWGQARPTAGNLAGVLPWTHARALALLGLLLLGNLFCSLCPFTLSRALARRLPWRRLAWPRALRGKWPAFVLLLVFFWCYEFLRVWDSPFWTACIVLAYFVASFLSDALFTSGRFCKHVCPVGQFGFAFSTLSPLEVRAHDVQICASCVGRDCLRGNARQVGCATDLLLPRKRGNLDCTFCLDCVRACPHDNAGLVAVAPARDLWLDPPRSGTGRYSQRTDLAALAALLVFAAFVNPAWMLEPVMAWRMRWTEVLGGGGSLWAESALWLVTLVMLPAVLLGASARWSAAAAGVSGWGAEIFRRMVLALLPLGFSMWLAHLGFHFATAAGSLFPAAARAALDWGFPLAGGPDWSQAMARGPSEDLVSLQFVALGVGVLVSLYAIWRVALDAGGLPRRTLAIAWPWGVLALTLYGLGIWILDQPMQMRGTWGVG